MRQTAIFPGRYLQQEGALEELGQEVARLGSNALIIAGRTARESIIPSSQNAWGEQVTAGVERFGGECSDEEIQGLTAIAIVPTIASTDAPTSAVSVIETIHHEPCPISPAGVVAALKTADRVGRQRRDL